MPQLDIVTFLDQVYSVYCFFIAQYIITSVSTLPNIYQILSFKNILFNNLSEDTTVSVISLRNFSTHFELLELSLDSKIC